MERRNIIKCWVIGGLFVCAGIVWLAGQSMMSARQEKLDAKLAEQDTVIFENAELQEDVDYSKTPEYIIREAHKLGYITDNEKLYLFDNDRQNSDY